MDQASHNKIVSFIWGIADDVLRDLFVRGKYRDVILPMCVLRRLDAVLEPTKKGPMTLMAYDLAPDGSAKFRKTLVDYAPQDGPDGLVCDKDGNLYVAVRDETRPGIVVYSPEGKELAHIKTELPTNVGFGRGAEAKTLYITAGKSLYRIKLNAEGYHLPPPK